MAARCLAISRALFRRSLGIQLTNTSQMTSFFLGGERHHSTRIDFSEVDMKIFGSAIHCVWQKLVRTVQNRQLKNKKPAAFLLFLEVNCKRRRPSVESLDSSSPPIWQKWIEQNKEQHGEGGRKSQGPKKSKGKSQGGVTRCHKTEKRTFARNPGSLCRALAFPKQKYKQP